jgi:hypothetical protein
MRLFLVVPKTGLIYDVADKELISLLPHGNALYRGMGGDEVIAEWTAYRFMH